MTSFMEWYVVGLVLAATLLLLGAVVSLSLFVMAVMLADHRRQVRMDEIFLPFRASLVATVVIATLGVPLLLVFGYKYKKLFWGEK